MRKELPHWVENIYLPANAVFALLAVVMRPLRSRPD